MAYDQDEHIVMLPFMAQGHQIPFLDLATKIQQKTNFTITIATTPLNLKYLQAHFQASTTLSNPNKIRLAELPFSGVDHGLPPNTENTENLPLSHIVNLGHASTTLEAPFRDLVVKITEEEGKPPICIIADVFLGWASIVAKSIGIYHATFSTGGAYGTAAYVSLWLNLPHRNEDSDEFTLPGFPATAKFSKTQLHRYLRAADGTDEWSKFFQTQISLSMNSNCWLCNTVEEIEISGLQILRDYIKLPVFPIGPLLPAKMLKAKTSGSASYDVIGQKRAGKEPGTSPEKCIEWLNTHKKSSVLYISFGSQNTINQTQMMELAKGLEKSENPFIWVIRPPAGFNITEDFQTEWLPENYETRLREKNLGLIIHKWAPQLEILSHESTGGFVSHCGWNSILESLSQGVPIIGWPLAAEQAYNSKMLVEEMGVGVELCRGLDGVLMAADVEKVVSFVMGENGGEIRRNAGLIKELIRVSVNDGVGGVKGSSTQAMDDFVDTIVSFARH